MKSKMKKENKPFWLKDDDEGAFAETFDEQLFDREFKGRASRKWSMGKGQQRQMARGDQLSPQKEVDLHGFTGPEAEMRVESFVQSAVHERLFMLRIITGKGIHSPGAPVLPDVVEQKLDEFKAKKLIKSFHWEKKRKSASGALIVFL